MRFSLRTLLIVLALGPPALVGALVVLKWTVGALLWLDRWLFVQHPR